MAAAALIAEYHASAPLHDQLSVAWLPVAPGLDVAPGGGGRPVWRTPVAAQKILFFVVVGILMHDSPHPPFPKMSDADALNSGDQHTFVFTENAGGGGLDSHTSLSACLGVAEKSWQVPPTWQQVLPWRARPATMVD